jgi:hypothetical protein
MLQRRNLRCGLSAETWVGRRAEDEARAGVEKAGPGAVVGLMERKERATRASGKVFLQAILLTKLEKKSRFWRGVLIDAQNWPSALSQITPPHP